MSTELALEPCAVPSVDIRAQVVSQPRSAVLQPAPVEPLSFRCGHAPAHLPLSVVALSEIRWSEDQRLSHDGEPTTSVGLVVAGTIEVACDGQMAEIGPGELYVLRAGSTSVVKAVRGPVQHLHLTLGGPVADPSCRVLPTRVVVRDPVALRTCFDDLIALLRAAPADQHARASCIAFRLLVLLVADGQDRAAASVLPLPVATALRILETSGARDLDVRQVARTVGTSVSHLHRLFKEAVGTSPLRYAREHLVAQAKDALGNTTLSCQEIARRLGYDDPLYFSAVFKRITGVSPREFRKRHR